jgi:hypothetical protein
MDASVAPLETRGWTYVNQKPYETGVVERAERSVIADDIVKTVMSCMSELGSYKRKLLRSR